jgi:outer membrane immunogenic protein
MKKILLGATALVAIGITAPASAADLGPRPYTKAPPPMMVAMYDWSGFYVGLNGGGGWSHKCWDLVGDSLVRFPAVADGCHNATGGTVGGQIGYRWQASSWVFGLEAQGNWANFQGDNISLVDPFFNRNHSKVDAFGLFTGQVGYAWNNVLLYVKGGAAVTNDKYSTLDLPTGIAFDSASETRWGGVVGVGLEYGFAPNWSFAVEYDHMFMGTRDVRLLFNGAFGTTVGVLSGIESIHQDVDVVTARINYRFGGPVLARY